MKKKSNTKYTKSKNSSKMSGTFAYASKSINKNIDADIKSEIAYQNKDIVSKFFGEGMKGKPLSLLGLDSKLKVVDIRPTNLPIVRARELRLDNLFELEDGSLVILDYESDDEEENFIKYGRYLMEVIDRYLHEEKQPDIHMMVIYTADIEHARTCFERTACQIKVEASYLLGAPSEEWLENAKKAIVDGNISDEILMHLILLPLTYKKKENKQEAIKKAVNLAKQIPDNKQKIFALAGLLAFTDKVISEETKRYVEEVLEMTQVGMMLMDKGRQEGKKEGDYERAKKTAIKMLNRGDSLEDIAAILEMPVETIHSWKKEFFVAEC